MFTCRNKQNRNLLIKNTATDSLFSSIARCSNVCKQSSGPFDHCVVSHPFKTRIVAISSCPVSNAFHNGELPSESKIDIFAPRLHKFSTTNGKCLLTANCKALKFSEDLKKKKTSHESQINIIIPFPYLLNI